MFFSRRQFSRPSSDAPMTMGESMEQHDELLFDLFDFVDRTADDVFAELQNSFDAQTAETVLHDVYSTLLKERRFIFWKPTLQKQRLDAIVQKMTKIQRSSIHQSADVSPLTRDQKQKLREALLLEYRALAAQRVQFVAPVSMVTTAVVGCFVLVSSVLIDPVSISPTSRQIAAAQTIVLEDVREYERVLSSAESNVARMLASSGRNEMASIAIDLAPGAINQQLNLEKNLRELLPVLHDKIILDDLGSGCDGGDIAMSAMLALTSSSSESER